MLVGFLQGTIRVQLREGHVFLHGLLIRLLKRAIAQPVLINQKTHHGENHQHQDPHADHLRGEYTTETGLITMGYKITAKHGIFPERVCPICGQKFSIRDRQAWAYKARIRQNPRGKGETKLVCSWKCVMDAERMDNGSEKDGRDAEGNRDGDHGGSEAPGDHP